MRNPVRLKNLRLRFLPFYALGLVAIAFMQPTPLGLAAGFVLAVAGEALRTWGAGHLVKNDRLTLTGPYAYIRHPLYAGTLLIAAGCAAIVGGWLGGALLGAFFAWFFLAYFPRKERVEAERLERIYGSEYTAYRASVPALIPRLRPKRLVPTQRGRWSGRVYDGNNELGTAIALLLGLGLLAVRSASLM
ncbi:MAG: methyltransferase family protein [Myxococcota bacterium]